MSMSKRNSWNVIVAYIHRSISLRCQLRKRLMIKVILITIAATQISTIGTVYAETVITRMATLAPGAIQNLSQRIGSPLTRSDHRTKSNPSAQFNEMPVPPSEFDAAVSVKRTGTHADSRLAETRIRLIRSLENGNWKETCDGAAWHLLMFLRHLKDKSPDDWRALRLGNPDDIKGYNSTKPKKIKKDFREIMEVYDDKCLESPSLHRLRADEQGVTVDGMDAPSRQHHTGAR